MKSSHHLDCVLKGDDSNEEATGHSDSSAGFMQKWEICGQDPKSFKEETGLGFYLI